MLTPLFRFRFSCAGKFWQTNFTNDFREFLRQRREIISVLPNADIAKLERLLSGFKMDSVTTRRQRKSRQDSLLPAIDSALAEKACVIDRGAREMYAGKDLQHVLRLTAEDAAGVVLRLRALPPAELRRLRAELLRVTPQTQFAIADSTAPPTKTRKLALLPLTHTELEPPSRKAERASGSRALTPPEPIAPRPLWPPVATYARKRVAVAPWIASIFADIAQRPLQYLSLSELGHFQAVSISMRAVADGEAWDRFRDFRYDPNTVLAGALGRETHRGRKVITRSHSHALWLPAFFRRKRFASFFERLDLSAAPASILEDPALQAAVARMPHVVHVALPPHGWSDSAKRAKFKKVLRPAVVVSFAVQGGDPFVPKKAL